MDPSSFRGVPVLSLSETLFFSATTITTVGLSDVKPASGIAKSLVVFELVTGIGLLSLLATFFATVHGPDLTEAVRITQELKAFWKLHHSRWTAIAAFMQELLEKGYADLIREKTQGENWRGDGSVAEKWARLTRYDKMGHSEGSGLPPK
jgi:hypothetical protein